MKGKSGCCASLRVVSRVSCVCLSVYFGVQAGEEARRWEFWRYLLGKDYANSACSHFQHDLLLGTKRTCFAHKEACFLVSSGLPIAQPPTLTLMPAKIYSDGCCETPQCVLPFHFCRARTSKLRKRRALNWYVVTGLAFW